MRGPSGRIWFAILGGAGVALVCGRLLRRRQAAERFAAAALEALLKAIDANDHETGRHVRRVAAYALTLAGAAKLPQHTQRAIERLALFHDIGKIHEALFDIIHEPARLTPAEKRAVATHPQLGADVLAPLTPFYPDLAEGVRSHHERWDGSGYPRGLSGRDIPLAARVVALADTFDALTHDRRYRAARTARAAKRVIAAGRGTQFDPTFADLMLSPAVFRQLMTLRRRALASATPIADRRARAAGSRRRPKEPVADVEFRWRPPAASLAR